MKNLQDATERICKLKGSLVALEALASALIAALPSAAHARMLASFDAHAEAARTVMLHADISELVLAAFERDVARHRAVMRPPAAAPAAADALLLTTTRLSTFTGTQALTQATGFFYRCDERLLLVSNRHVFVDAGRGHRGTGSTAGVDRRQSTAAAGQACWPYDRCISKGPSWSTAGSSTASCPWP